MSNWQQQLSQGFSSASDLLAFLEIEPAHASLYAEQQFKTKVPRGFAARMKQGDIYDPLLKQVLAVHDELEIVAHYSTDPLGEKSFNPMPGLIHKYHNRVLLMLSGACAVHCRYCFRRHFPYQDNQPGKLGLREIVDYLKRHPQVNEVILSGGDPMLLNNHYFQTILEYLQELTSLKVVRIHSRIPVVLPSRIEQDWLQLFAPYPWQKIMVTHANHAQELDESVTHAISLLKSSGWMVLNQAVLLAGVNDTLQAQISLSHQLLAAGILPYYLHLLDPVQGAAHFEVPQAQAMSIYSEMQRHLSGYMVPKLVKEQPGRPHKTLVYADMESCIS